MLTDIGHKTSIDFDDISAWWPAKDGQTPSLFIDRVANPLPKDKARMIVQLRSGTMISTYHSAKWLTQHKAESDARNT